jgi:acyl-CoA synthetase (AMP-forming)/AMP-acid ligase II
MIDCSPFLSILLPIRNESDYLKSGLLAILEQNYPPECVEILIADGMSTDNSRSLIRDISALHPHRQFRILDNPGKIVPTGLNIALRQAKGDINIRVDEHCIITQNYVRHCVEHIQKDSVVVGPDGREMVRFHGVFVKQPNVLEGQIIQDTLDHIHFKVVVTDDFTEEDTQDIIRRVQQRLGPSVKVSVEIVNAIPRTKSGKFKAVISNLKKKVD